MIHTFLSIYSNSYYYGTSTSEVQTNKTKVHVIMMQKLQHNAETSEFLALGFDCYKVLALALETPSQQMQNKYFLTDSLHSVYAKPWHVLMITTETIMQ